MTAPCLALDDTFKRLKIPLKMVYGYVATIHKLLIRMQTVRGTWSDDVLFGLPWLDWTTNTPDIEIEGVVRSQAILTQDILSVVSVSVLKTSDVVSITLVVQVASDTGPMLIKLGGIASYSAYQTPWYELLGVDFTLRCP